MNDLLQELLGKEVEVRSQAGQRDCYDSGTLVAYDEKWIKIEKGQDFCLYYPIVNVRLLKPL